MRKLTELNRASFADDHVLALDGENTIAWSQLIADISASRAQLEVHPSDAWALFHTDCYTFAVGLIALLAEGKTLYLPAENHAAIATDLQNQNVQLLGQFPTAPHQDIASGEKSGPSGDFSLTGSIVVYTSGSTGAAKPITKTLAQLENELLTLESHWGAHWRNPVVASTVSHQHLYGLLFSLLWPLCAGRRFCRKAFIDPAIMASQNCHFEEVVWTMSPAHLHRMPDNMPWLDVHNKIEAVFSSGGPLDLQAAQHIHEKLGLYPTEVLGSSETGGIAWREQVEATAPWHPLPGVDIKTDEIGRLTVRSPWLEDEDWLNTADLATLSPDGTFQLGMRSDRIVKLEGKRVALPATESALIDHPWVKDAVAILISRQRQALGAALVLSQAGSVAYKELGRHGFTKALRQTLRQGLASPGVPRYWRVVAELPRNAQGKVLEKSIRILFNEPTLPTTVKREVVGNKCVLELKVDGNNPYFAGHFPDRAVLAGVVQLLWAQHFGIEYLGVIGKFSGMKAIKFRQLVFPDTSLHLTLEYMQDSGRLKFHYQSSDGHHSQGILLYGADA